MRLLISHTSILERLAALADQLRADACYPNLQPVVLAEGARPMARDLLPRLPELPCPVTIRVSSYGDAQTPLGTPRVLDPWPEIRDELGVLLIDDVLDTGNTLVLLRDRFVAAGVQPVRICVLLEKRTVERRPIDADYTGFTIDSQFVVGYGMDLAGRYRDMPDIAVLD